MLFTKMQGLGNDYVYVDERKERIDDPGLLAKQVSDRHFGIGADGLILIGSSRVADVRMRMFNADGSEGSMCGNGIRCVAKYAYENGIVSKNKIKIETLSGIKETEILQNGDVRVNMGYPKIQNVYQKIWVEQQCYDGDSIWMGNPHTVVYVTDPKKLDLECVGPIFEHWKGEAGVNTEFVKVLNRNTVEMRVWERGSGETLACGTGACATAVSAIFRNLIEREVLVKLRGGDLRIQWNENDGNIYMTGPAVTVFQGEMN